MANPIIYSSELNPIIFYNEDRATTDKYQTAHFENFMHNERGKDWLQSPEFCQIWQVTEIVAFQYQSEFDPIVIDLLDENNNVIINLPMQIIAPNKYLPGTFIFEAQMSLAGLATGCYRFRRTLGTGLNQKIQYSSCQYISSEKIEGTLLFEYNNSKYFKDVIFETGVTFQLRIHGWINYDRQGRVSKQEVYKDQKYNQSILSSVSSKQAPIYHGNEFGLPTDILNIIEQIWECNNVLVDGKPVCIADGSKFEYVDIEGYRMRGMHSVIEPAINRNSRITSIGTDTNKKMMVNINVESSVFGDLSNSGSNNTIPVINIVQE